MSFDAKLGDVEISDFDGVVAWCVAHVKGRVRHASERQVHDTKTGKLAKLVGLVVHFENEIDLASFEAAGPGVFSFKAPVKVQVGGVQGVGQVGPVTVEKSP